MASKNSLRKKNLTFESGAEELNVLLEKLGRDELPLEEAIALYERGTALCAQMKEMLDMHRKRIEQIDPETAEINVFEGNEYGI